MNSDKKGKSEPLPSGPGSLIRLTCPVCGSSDEVRERVAQEQFHCKECGVFSKLGVHGLAVEVDSKPFTPSTRTILLCATCELTFWGMSGQEVQCVSCGLVLAPQIPRVPDKMPLKAECRDCGRWFPIESKDSTLCMLCRGARIPPTKSRFNRGNMMICCLLASVLVVLLVFLSQLLREPPAAVPKRVKGVSVREVFDMLGPPTKYVSS
jgi:hypothetical protein